MRMYFIALVLPAHLDERILLMKHDMRDRYGCKAALRSPAHITLIPPFWMDESLEGPLADKLDEVSADLSPLVIEHNGFSSFPPKTIFIRAVPNPMLEQLHQTVNTFFRQHPLFPIKFDSRPFHPHVTIATRDLTKKSYQDAWSHYKDKKFEKSWTCSSVSLLVLTEEGWKVLHISEMRRAV